MLSHWKVPKKDEHNVISREIRENSTFDPAHRLVVTEMVRLKSEVARCRMRKSLKKMRKKYDEGHLRILYFPSSLSEERELLDERSKTESFEFHGGLNDERILFCPDPVGSAFLSISEPDRVILRCVIYMDPFSFKKTSMTIQNRKFFMFAVTNQEHIFITHIIKCKIRNTMNHEAKGYWKGCQLATKFDINTIFEGQGHVKNQRNEDKRSTFQKYVYDPIKSAMGYETSSQQRGKPECILDKYRCRDDGKCGYCDRENHVKKYFHPCKFGKKCRLLERRERLHMNRFFHPCKYGSKCVDQSDKHRLMFSHPPKNKSRKAGWVVRYTDPRERKKLQEEEEEESEGEEGKKPVSPPNWVTRGLEECDRERRRVMRIRSLEKKKEEEKRKEMMEGIMTMMNENKKRKKKKNQKREEGDYYQDLNNDIDLELAQIQCLEEMEKYEGSPLVLVPPPVHQTSTYNKKGRNQRQNYDNEDEESDLKLSDLKMPSSGESDGEDGFIWHHQ